MKGLATKFSDRGQVTGDTNKGYELYILGNSL